MEELIVAIGVAEGKSPVKYLGIPLCVNYLKARNYVGLIDKCGNQLEGWKSNTLSFTSRIELI